MEHSTQIRRGLHYLAQWILAIAVIGMWIICWLVESGTLLVPTWGRDWSEASESEVTTYAATLLTIVSMMFVLCVVIGWMQIRRGY